MSNRFEKNKNKPRKSGGGGGRSDTGGHTGGRSGDRTNEWQGRGSGQKSGHRSGGDVRVGERVGKGSDRRNAERPRGGQQDRPSSAEAVHGAFMRIAIRVLPHGRGLPLPSYQSELAAGLDLQAAVDEKRPLVVDPGEHLMVPTGLAFAIPAGFEGQVRPRSGLAFKHGITVLNSPGTVDADYRGEVQVLLINHGDEPFRISRGDRIAQLVIAPVVRAEWAEVRELPRTDRGQGGFGSTGSGASERRGSGRDWDRGERRQPRQPENEGASGDTMPGEDNSDDD